MSATPMHLADLMAEPGRVLRPLTLDAETLGRLRRELFWTLGETRTHGVLARMGVSWGQADTIRASDPSDAARSLAAWTYEPPADQDEHVVDIEAGVEWAAHGLFFDTPSKEPQCWLTAGYLTGWLSGRLGKPIYVMELHCRAKGDSQCRFVGREREAWPDEAAASLALYEEDNMVLELFTTRDELRLTRDRFQNLFEQSSVPVLIVDPATSQCLNANLAAEEITGYSREEMLRLSVFDLCHSKDHQLIAAQIKNLVAEGRGDDEETSLVRKDGSLRTISRSSKILTYGGQRVIQMVLRDITDLKISEQKEKDLQSQLVRSERLSSIGRLAAGVAHELKNPLGAIRNAVYYIRNVLKDNPVLETDPHLAEILKLAESEVDGAVTIIGELLDFSRIVQLVPRRTQVNELLEYLPQIITVPSNVQLAMDLDLTLPSARLDPDRLTQVFCNIANNAIQAMPNGGKLTISTRFVIETAGEENERQERIEVSFQDTGCGIDPIHLAKIFEPLFTTKARGTGLGLAISSNIVEKHGGVIHVTSQVGKGSTFAVKLPLEPPPDKEDTR